MSLSAKNLFGHAILKPVVAGAICVAGNQFVLGETNMVSNLYFGAAVAGGIGLVLTVEPFVQKMMPTSTPLGNVAKTLESRVIEIALGSGAVYALNKYVLKNDFQPSQYMHKVFLIGASDVISESIMELFMVV